MNNTDRIRELLREIHAAEQTLAGLRAKLRMLVAAIAAPLLGGLAYLLFGFAQEATMDHLIHHRAQLTVYLRMLDVPVQQTYGPTADFPDM